MRIAILGTGRVAQTLAAGLLRTGHDVVFGSRDPQNRTGLPAPVLASADAVVGADVVLNAVQGVDTIPLLTSIGPDNLDGALQQGRTGDERRVGAELLVRDPGRHDAILQNPRGSFEFELS